MACHASALLISFLRTAQERIARRGQKGQKLQAFLEQLVLSSLFPSLLDANTRVEVGILPKSRVVIGGPNAHGHGRPAEVPDLVRELAPTEDGSDRSFIQALDGLEVEAAQEHAGRGFCDRTQAVDAMQALAGEVGEGADEAVVMESGRSIQK